MFLSISIAYVINSCSFSWGIKAPAADKWPPDSYPIFEVISDKIWFKSISFGLAPEILIEIFIWSSMVYAKDNMIVSFWYRFDFEIIDARVPINVSLTLSSALIMINPGCSITN